METTQSAVGLEADEAVDEHFKDRDRDLLPSAVERMLSLSPSSRDTDQDGQDDFAELITHQSHLSRSSTALDHGLRVLVSAVPNSAGDADVWVHLVIRTVGVDLSAMQLSQLYLSRNGTRYPIQQLLSFGGLRVASKVVQGGESRYVLSVRLVNESALARLAPCTVGASVTVGGETFTSGCFLQPSGSGVAAVLPYSDRSFALLPINSSSYLQDSNPYYRGGGRVCEMGLTAVGESSAGTICEVDWADCKPAAGLRCSTTCDKRSGSVMVVPDGLGGITGGN